MHYKRVLYIFTMLCIFNVNSSTEDSEDKKDAEKEAEKDLNKLCYHAQICVHSAVEKCGVNSNGKYRRFYDSCDITEYNCLKDTDYKKTDKKHCEELPALTRRRK